MSRKCSHVVAIVVVALFCSLFAVISDARPPTRKELRKFQGAYGAALKVAVTTGGETQRSRKKITFRLKNSSKRVIQGEFGRVRMDPVFIRATSRRIRSHGNLSGYVVVGAAGSGYYNNERKSFEGTFRFEIRKNGTERRPKYGLKYYERAVIGYTTLRVSRLKGVKK